MGRAPGWTVSERPSTSVEALAEGVRTGDGEAEREFVERYGRRIYALMLARLHDLDAAEDLTQETLVSALVALRNGNLLSPDKLSGYLRGIARNVCNNYLRGLPQRPQELPENTPSSELDPEMRFRRREIWSIVGRSLSQLNEIDQRILLWSFVDELSSSTIGSRLGITGEAVRQRKRRALLRIQSRSQRVSQIQR